MVYTRKKKKSLFLYVFIYGSIITLFISIIVFFVTLNKTIYKQEKSLGIVHKELCVEYNLICKNIHIYNGNMPYYILDNDASIKVYDVNKTEIGVYLKKDVQSLNSLKSKVASKVPNVVSANYGYDKDLIIEVKASDDQYFYYSYYNAFTGDFIKSYSLRKGK